MVSPTELVRSFMEFSYEESIKPSQHLFLQYCLEQLLLAVHNSYRDCITTIKDDLDCGQQIMILFQGCNSLIVDITMSSLAEDYIHIVAMFLPTMSMEQLALFDEDIRIELSHEQIIILQVKYGYQYFHDHSKNMHLLQQDGFLIVKEPLGIFHEIQVPLYVEIVLQKMENNVMHEQAMVQYQLLEYHRKQTHLYYNYLQLQL